jgi:hypothetical protein
MFQSPLAHVSMKWEQPLARAILYIYVMLIGTGCVSASMGPYPGSRSPKWGGLLTNPEKKGARKNRF